MGEVEGQYLLRKIYKKRNISLRNAVKILFEKFKLVVSHTPIRNFYSKEGIRAFAPIKKPRLTANHIKTRLHHSLEFLTFSDYELDNIILIFSDESKFNLFRSDGIVKVWRKAGEGLKPGNIISTVKFEGGSIMVWGCFSSRGVGKLVFIEGMMTGPDYVRILSNNLNESIEMMGIRDTVFQQDNNPKHILMVAMRYFEEKEITVLNWPAQSPDLNPIETLWGLCKRKMDGFNINNIHEYKRELERIWYAIPPETCYKLCRSFRDRAEVYVRAGGKHTKY